MFWTKYSSYNEKQSNLMKANMYSTEDWIFEL